MAKRAKHLLLVITDMHYGREVIRGVQQYCRQNGEWDFRREPDSDPDSIKKVRLAMREWKVDGIIARVFEKRMLTELRRTGLPVVNISGVMGDHLPTVRSDDAAVGRMAAEYLMGNGFRSFAFCAMTGETFVQSRCKAFVRRLAEGGFGCEVFTDTAVGTMETDWPRNRARMRQWLRKLKKPVALMCMYDSRAQEVALACRRLGIRMPEEVALVGVGNQDWICELCSPPLSSVDTDMRRIGFEAVRMLDQMMHGRKPERLSVYVPPLRLEVRQSSDIVAIEDETVAAAMRFIRRHAQELISVKDLMSELPMSRRILEMRFVKLVGRTPKAEIMRLRMERAKRLLEDTDWLLAAVAQASGFAGQEIFSASFRREVGASPTEYRKRRRMEGEHRFITPRGI